MLVLVTVAWGLSFPLMRSWQQAAADCPAGPQAATLTFIFLRMALALVILAALRPRLVWGLTAVEYAAGAVVGGAFFAGSVFQVYGLAFTTPARSGFLTSLACLWVPLIGRLVFQRPIRRALGLSIALGIAGTALLSGLELSSRWNRGDGCTILATAAFAVQILALDHFGRRVRPAHLTAGMLLSVAALAGVFGLAWAGGTSGIAPLAEWLRLLARNRAAWEAVGGTAVFSTVLAFHWMNTYQPSLSPARAALIYLLEPLFATAFSIILGFEHLTLGLLLGGGLIVLSNLIAAA